jgi:Ion channel
MTTKHVTLLFGVLPFLTNAFLAVSAFYSPEDFKGNDAVALCYVTAMIAFGAAIVCLLGYSSLYIGPTITLGTVLAQSVVLIFTFAGIYKGHGVLTSNGIYEPLVNDASGALYFSVVTWTTLGYGDLVPLKDIRLVAALEALMGYAFFGLTVGLGTYLLSREKSVV